VLDRLADYSPCLDAPERWAVATVVEVSGSVPRPIGTSMAVRDDALTIGSISGGCVESAIVQAALTCIADRRAILSEFGYTDSEGLVAGLMCGGDITVLIQPVTHVAAALASAGFGSEMPDVAGLDSAVMLRELPARVGMRGGEIVDAQEDARPQAAPAALVWRAGGDVPEDWARVVGHSDAAVEEIIRRGGCGIVEVRDDSVPECPTRSRLFVETRTPRARILIYGANDFSAAIARAVSLLGHHVTVCDARAAFATRQRHPGADEVVVERPGEHFARECEAGRVDSRTAVIMLTHDPRFDLPVLDRALRMDLAYVGAMGSRTTHERREQELLHGGLPQECFERLHSPIGLDIGARTPQEVAVAVLAEYIACIHGRTADSGVPELRHTAGPVHASRTAHRRPTHLRALKEEPSWT
jgi:xanthine dehydrogenase accessory factor